MLSLFFDTVFLELNEEWDCLSWYVILKTYIADFIFNCFNSEHLHITMYKSIKVCINKYNLSIRFLQEWICFQERKEINFASHFAGSSSENRKIVKIVGFLYCLHSCPNLQNAVQSGQFFVNMCTLYVKLYVNIIL